MSQAPFNPYSKKAPVFFPSFKYQADGSSRLFETEEEFNLEGEGWFDSIGAAEAADGAPAAPAKAPKGGKGGKAAKAQHAAPAEVFDRDAAIAQLHAANYDVSEDTTNEELQEALKELAG